MGGNDPMFKGDIKFEIIGDPKKELDKNRLEIISSLMKAGWGECDSILKDYIIYSDTLILVKNDQKYIAFQFSRSLNNETLFIVASVIHPDFQGLGINRELAQLSVLQFLRSLGIAKGFLLMLKGFFIVFRTANPRAYEALFKLVGNESIFPSLTKSHPTVKELKIAKDLTSIFFPKIKFDKEKFIFQGAFLYRPSLIYKNIPWTRNEKINILFETGLNLSKRLGNAFLVVGRLKINTILLTYLGR